MVVGFACQWSSLLLRPDEVLSGIPDAFVLEVAYNALGILFQPHHMRIGGLTSFGFWHGQGRAPIQPRIVSRTGIDSKPPSALLGAVFLELVPQRSFADVEQRRGLGLVAVGLGQRVVDQARFEVFDRLVQCG